MLITAEYRYSSYHSVNPFLYLKFFKLKSWENRNILSFIKSKFNSRATAKTARNCLNVEGIHEPPLYAF